VTKNQKILIGIGAVVAIGAIVAVSVYSQSEESGEEVYMAEVERQDIVSSVSASGMIEARTKVNVQSSVIGEIVELPVEEGDAVRRGDLLVQIDPERYRSEVDRLSANVRMQKIQLREAEVRLADALRRLERSRDLYDGSGLVSRESLEQAELQAATGEIAIESLREQIAQAEASLARARDDLAKTTIRSPMDGTVTQLNAEKGEITLTGTMNNPGTIIMVVSDMGEILAEVDVDETRVVQVEHGQRARVVVDAVGETRPYLGTVNEIAGTATQRQGEQVRVFPVKVVLDEVDPQLRPGMTAKAKITTESAEDMLTVPIQAVVLRPQKEVDEALSKREEPAEEEAGEAESAEESAADATGGSEPEPPSEEAEATAAARTQDPEESEPAPESDSNEPAVTAGGDREVVFRVVDGKAVLTPVKTGLSDDASVAILEGLNEEDTVITGPYRTVKKLKDGDAVKKKAGVGEDEESESESGVQVEVD
jgi:HlyD family secretion protein